ncbi:uncharacterized protein J4E78_005247 [Alternaria triticimaculans]|uniref:uncharacterized protein n=1 Tax=Alternaria triticimaculans TaxID=297637 RepID=UPI0020C445E3|nr:uncharacterized protein J4E78_005247 [Alternaria triticimaculans]KAI4660544.1 hypothetical protein J4E78_005247 [Alternaria triticimaculans]
MDRLRKRFSSKYKGRAQAELIANVKPAAKYAPNAEVAHPDQDLDREGTSVSPFTTAGAQELTPVEKGIVKHGHPGLPDQGRRNVSPDLIGRGRLQSSNEASTITPIDTERRLSSQLSPPPSSSTIERRSGSFQSVTSNFASMSVSNEPHDKSQSAHRRMNPLGLTVIHEPEGGHSLDIVLIHGLGGSSHSTWSKNHDPNYFWPHLWLPSEPAIGSARILSFGYDADWKSTSSRTVLNITDFAKELLFAMKFTKDENRDLEDLGLGDVPIIFIVHSMGGLVVKKAYILGQSDDEYSEIVKSINAIIFLSTPHRGSNMAELLNRVLSASLLRFSPKQYVADLQKNSPALEDINEQFRKFAPKLHIVSFYETLDTPVGPKKVRILEKESAILGYPGEISRAMNADHHDVCKYYSPSDANYISMRDVLKTLVDRVRAIGISFRRSSSASSDASEAVEALLSIQNLPYDDFNFFHDQWMPGTCDWILQESSFQTWMDDTTQSSILWLHARPGSGKSVLSSFIIDQVKLRGQTCQFYFFRFGDQSKRSINGCLRSMAFQLSGEIPQYRRRMRDLSEDGLRLEKTDARTVWNRLFVTALLTLRQTAPLYWVIDALDEADSPELLLGLLNGLQNSVIPIKLLVVSRETTELRSEFDQLGKSIPVETLPITHKSQQDVQAYVESRMALPRWDEGFKKEVTDMILQRAEGNFLWVHLAIKEALKRHTTDDIREALGNMPIGMEAMYHRMASVVAKDMGSTDKQLARRILTWAMFSRRALTLKELEEALRPSFNRILDLRSTITATCGFFVVVDMSENVTMIHQTARDYLTHTPELDLYIDAEQTHLESFRHCMASLMDTGVRSKLNQTNAELKRNFVNYAATSWSFHLGLATRIDSAALSTLLRCDTTPRALAFSPDSRRFYEIRDAVCTAWEPAALADLQETGDQSEDQWETQSDISTLNDSIQIVGQEDQITALAVTLHSKYFCAGNEVGEVYLFNAEGTKVLNVSSSPRYMMIDLLAWDDSGERLAIAELGGDISVKHVFPPAVTDDPKRWNVQPILNLSMSSQLGTAQQVLFSPDGTFLLLVRQHGVQVLSLEEKKLSCQYHGSSDTAQRWINDPRDSQYLLKQPNSYVTMTEMSQI